MSWSEIFQDVDLHLSQDMSKKSEILEPSNQIVDLINQIFSEKDVYYILTYEFFQKLISLQHILVGVKDEDVLVGVVLGIIFDNKIYVSYFCLKDEYRGRGWGLDMIKKLMYVGRERDYGYHTVAKSIKSSKPYRYFFRPIRPYSCRKAGYVFPEYGRKVERDIWRTSSQIHGILVKDERYPCEVYEVGDSRYGFFLTPLSSSGVVVTVAVMMFFKSEDRENTFMAMINSVAKTEAIALHLGETDILDLDFLLSMNCLTAGSKTFYLESFPPERFDPEYIHPIF